MKALLISEDNLKKMTIINDNVDWQTIKPIVMLVQDLYLQKLLGTDLYQKLMNDVIASLQPSPTPIPSNYKTLIDVYIADYLQWMIVAHAGTSIKYRYMNKGVMEKSSDNSSPISYDNLKAITDTWLNYAQEYGQILVKYINDNLTLYPEYLTNSGVFKNQPIKVAYDSPFVFSANIDPSIGLSEASSINYNDWWNVA